MSTSPQPRPRRTPCARNWTPGPAWAQTAQGMEWNWSDWDATATAWCDAALQHQACHRGPADDVLQGLLEQRRAVVGEERKAVNKAIWRHRRRLQRQRARARLRVAAARGAAPARATSSSHVNFAKLFGQADAQGCIHNHFADVYQLAPDEEDRERREKEHWVAQW
eukprot:3235044-Alexandrium_andersonii.AAC.1